MNHTSIFIRSKESVLIFDKLGAMFDQFVQFLELRLVPHACPVVRVSVGGGQRSRAKLEEFECFGCAEGIDAAHADTTGLVAFAPDGEFRQH